MTRTNGPDVRELTWNHRDYVGTHLVVKKPDAPVHRGPIKRIKVGPGRIAITLEWVAWKDENGKWQKHMMPKAFILLRRHITETLIGSTGAKLEARGQEWEILPHSESPPFAGLT